MKRLLVLSAAILVLAGLSLAQPTMGNGTKIAVVTGGVRWSQCAFGPDGVLHVCFEEDTNRGHPIWYVKYDGTTASTPFMVTDSLDVVGERPNIAVGPRGHIAVLWGVNSGKSIFMRVYNPKTKEWGSVETVKAGYGYEEPCAAIDADGNIFTFWSDGDGGRVYTRAKINGAWQDTVKHNGAYGKQGGICMAPNGTIFITWREKGSGGNYKNYWDSRTKTTNWGGSSLLTSSGGSSSHPFPGVGTDNVGFAVWGDIDPLNETGAEIRLIKMQSGAQREIIVPFAMQHYPRPAVDINNKTHVAVQLGGGDFGSGCVYVNNVTGSWSSPQSIMSSMDKVPGISADGYGNVAICMSNMRSDGSDIYVWSLTNISPRYIYPPSNLASSIKIKSVHTGAAATYSLSWTANPTNTDAWISGYAIYVSENGGEYTLLSSVAKSTLSATFTFNDLTKKRRFAICSVNPGGGESDLIEF